MITGVFRNQRLVALVLVIGLIAGLFEYQSPGFISLGNVMNVLVQAAPTIIVAVPMTFVLAAGWLDLSAGAVMYLSIVGALTLSGTTTGVNGSSGLGTYFVALGLGVALGLLNAVLIQVLKVHPLLVTLGTLTLFRGIALHVVDSGNRAADGLIQLLGRTSFGPVPAPVIIALGMVVGGALLLHFGGFGRVVLAIGGSKRSAIETGVRLNRIRLGVFAFLGFAAALSGIVVAGRTGTAQTSLGEGFEFTVITAVVVGGTSLFGGKGTVVGSALGAVLLALVANGLNRVDASIYFYDVAVGIALLFAVVADSLSTRGELPRQFRVSPKRETVLGRTKTEN